MKTENDSLKDKDQLNRDIPIPLYYQLKSILFEKIQNKLYREGDIIPTEAELQETYQISRSTVRQAIAELVQEGWLDRRTSKGTFVTYPKSEISHIHPFEPFYQQVKQLGKTSKTELIHLSIIPSPSDLSGSMGLSAGTKIISMFRRRFTDDEPLVTIHNFLPFEYCSFILSHDFRFESLYETLKNNPMTRIEQTKTIVSAENASGEDALLLQIAVDSPILCFNTIARNEAGIVIDYAFSHYRGDRNRFEIDVRPEK